MKLSDYSDQDWFNRLSGRRNFQTQQILKWWEYYDGEQPLYYVAKILAEQDDRFPPLLINWSRKYISALDGRCNLEGFGYVGEDTLDDHMQAIFLRNELDSLQSINNIASLVTGISYAMIGPTNEGARISIEAPHSMAVETDSLTGKTIAGIKFWSSDPINAIDDRAILLLPDKIRGGSRLIEYEYGKPVGEVKQQQWMAGPAKLQTSPDIPIVPFFNNERWGRGYSQLADLRPLVDAANQVATNMLAAVEHHAVPRKWALGVSEDSFKDENGNTLPAWKIATGAVWMNPYDSENPDATPQVGQFAPSDLRNFHDTLGVLARMGAGLANMSPHEFGFGVSDNPPSADSIIAAQSERIGQVERINRARGAAYERVMRIALAIEGEAPNANRLIDAKFRNAATPTRQAMSAAAVATYGAGISDLYQARLDSGYSPTQIAAMEAREAAAGVAQDEAFNRANRPLVTDAVNTGNA